MRTGPPSLSAPKPWAKTMHGTSSVVSGRTKTPAHSASPERKRASVRTAETVSGETIDALGQLEVVGRQAPLRMRRDRHRDGVPRNREVWMVAHLLRGLDDRLGEVNRADEVVLLELLADRVT